MDVSSTFLGICIKNDFNPTKIFVLQLFKMAANSRLNSGISSIVWWLRSANNMIFTEEYLMWTKKHILVKEKSLQIARTWVCLNTSESKRQVFVTRPTKCASMAQGLLKVGSERWIVAQTRSQKCLGAPQAFS